MKLLYLHHHKVPQTLHPFLLSLLICLFVRSPAPPAPLFGNFSFVIQGQGLIIFVIIKTQTCCSNTGRFQFSTLSSRVCPTSPWDWWEGNSMVGGAQKMVRERASKPMKSQGYREGSGSQARLSYLLSVGTEIASVRGCMSFTLSVLCCWKCHQLKARSWQRLKQEEKT